MPKLFLIPVINVLDVHDTVMREWLSSLEDISLKEHFEYPFKLERFFPESARHALISVNRIHEELLSLFDNIDPQAVFLNISTDLYELENKYNKRLVSPLEFWLEYYENISNDISEPARTLFRIYLKDIIGKNIRLIESKERLPLNVLFYGLNMRSRDELIPVYEEVFKLAEDFTLQMARAVNEIMNLREKPKQIWHSSFKAIRIRISYEETVKFYDELLVRLKRLLKYKARDYFVKSLWEHARAYAGSHERFLEHKIREDEIKFSNITEGLKISGSQIEPSEIVILCEPMDYTAIHDFLKNNVDLACSGFSMQEISLTGLFEKMKPFIQKNRIMQSNYEIAMDILGREIPERFIGPDAILFPK